MMAQGLSATRKRIGKLKVKTVLLPAKICSPRGFHATQQPS